MKSTARILGVIALVMTLSWPAKAFDIKSQIGEAKYDQAIANLLVALKSDNAGLKKSAAYVLGEIQAGEAVIPLMAFLHNSSDVSGRIAAAWALCKIGDARGIYAVKGAVRFDESKKVQSYCAWFYNIYVQSGTFTLTPPPDVTNELTLN